MSTTMIQQVVLLGVLSFQGIESFSPASNKLLNVNAPISSSWSSDPLPRRRRNANGLSYINGNERSNLPTSSYFSNRTGMVKEGTDLLAELKSVKASSSSDLSPSTTSTDNGETNSSSSTKNLFFCEDVNTPSSTGATAAATGEPTLDKAANDETPTESPSFSYGEFAKQYPFINNVAIATTKTGAADFIAQTVIGGTPIYQLDIERSILFMTFGAVYSGGFQWLYQVNIFKKLFDIEKFTNLSIKEKLEDKEGLKQLMFQTALDLTVLTLAYLPAFYIFKAGVFSGSVDPNIWMSTGLNDYMTNFAKDEADLLKVWFPADLVCFSVPLYLRLPVRHSVSFLWTAYLSFARGGH